MFQHISLLHPFFFKNPIFFSNCIKFRIIIDNFFHYIKRETIVHISKKILSRRLIHLTEVKLDTK